MLSAAPRPAFVEERFEPCYEDERPASDLDGFDLSGLDELVEFRAPDAGHVAGLGDANRELGVGERC